MRKVFNSYQSPIKQSTGMSGSITDYVDNMPIWTHEYVYVFVAQAIDMGLPKAAAYLLHMFSTPSTNGAVIYATQISKGSPNKVYVKQRGSGEWSDWALIGT